LLSKELKMKKCARCGELKDITEFYKDRRSGDGLQGYCKQCKSEYNRKHYDTETNLKKSRRWRKNNPTYISWCGMRARCEYKNHISYPWYGGKGVSVCDRWRGRGGYKNFLADMGERPTVSGVPHQIDRIDPDGDYTPENCRWLTQSENIARRRRP
jgi:hypothetical protein